MVIKICPHSCRLSKSGGGVSGDEPSFAEAMAEEYKKYQEEHGITDDELEEFGEWVTFFRVSILNLFMEDNLFLNQENSVKNQLTMLDSQNKPSPSHDSILIPCLYPFPAFQATSKSWSPARCGSSPAPEPKTAQTPPITPTTSPLSWPTSSGGSPPSSCLDWKCQSQRAVGGFTTITFF